MGDLDLKDRKILLELETDCRQPVSQIARKAGLSKTAVLHRIERLQKEKIIDDFATVTNGNKLGYTIYTVLLKLQGSMTVKEDVLAFIKSQPEVGWCIQVFGNRDIIFAALVQDIIQLQNLLETIEQKFSDQGQERDILSNIQTHPFVHKYLYQEIKQNGPIASQSYGVNHSRIELSTNECSVLNYLKRHPREQIVKIAEDTCLSTDTVKRSLTNLVKQGIVIRFKAHLNVFDLRYQWNVALISLKSMGPEGKSRLFEYITQDPHMVYAVECVGRWNLILNIHTTNNEHFKEVYWRFRKTFDDVIKNDEVLAVARKQKHFFNPVLL